MKLSWTTIPGLFGHWVIMTLGFLLYVALRRLFTCDPAFNWNLWGQLVLFGTLVDFLIWNYSRPRKKSNDEEDL